MTNFKSFEPKRFSKAKYYQERPNYNVGLNCSEICAVCGYTKGDHAAFINECPIKGKATRRYSTKPRKGDVRYLQGIRFVHNGQYFEQDGVVSTIDRHHSYSGHQDPKKPYRGAKDAHVICGNKLCR